MLKVLRQRDFSLLWFAGLISLIGDWMLVVALPVAVYELTGSALATAGLLIARQLPTLALGSVAGVFVDRWDRKWTMVVANLVRAPILLLLFAVNSADQIWLVYVVAFAVSTFSQFFRPAENAMLPRLVSEDHLVPANALNSLNDNLSRLIGPALGGLVAGLFGLGGVALADSASFLVAGVLILAIATPTRAERTPVEDAREARRASAMLRHEWLDGLRMIRQNPALRVVFGVIAIGSIGEGVFGTALWVYIEEVLKGGAREAGWVVSAQAVGGLIGSVVIGAWAKGVAPGRLLGWGWIGLGLIDLMIFNYPSVIPGVWPALVLMAIVGIPASAGWTGYTTVMQVESQDAYRGRVFGALNTTSAMLMIVGAVIAGVATARLGVVVILSIDSVAYVISGAIALRLLGGGVVRRLATRDPVQGNI